MTVPVPPDDPAAAGPAARAVAGPGRAALTGVWWRVLVVGLLSWGGALVAATTSPDLVLIPLVPLIGSFLVPFALLVLTADYVARLAPAGRTALGPVVLVVGFGAGGALGVWPAGWIESGIAGWLPAGFLVGVAVVEEAVKLAVVCLVAWGLASYRRRDGMLLGAAVGLGFAAFESLGYAYATATSLTAVDGAAAAELLLSRAMLVPLGHALWTALVAGALFAGSRAGRLRVSPGLVGWFAVAVALHLAWDVSAGVAAVIAAGLLGRPVTESDFVTGAVPGLHGADHAVVGVIRFALLALNGAVGLWLLRFQWRTPDVEPAAAPAHGATPPP